MAKFPSFMFYPGDWLKDPALRRCSFAAKGAFIDLLCIMFESEERGVLITGGSAWSPEEAAQALGGSKEITLNLVRECLQKGVLKHRESDGAIYSARMVRDEEMRKVRSECGKRGGNPVLLKQIPSNPLKPPDNHSLKMKMKIEDEEEISSEKGGVGENTVELPPNFPETEVKAVEMAGMVGVPQHKIQQYWNEAKGRAGTDCYGKAIVSWAYHVKGRWLNEQNKQGMNGPVSFRGNRGYVAPKKGGF